MGKTLLDSLAWNWQKIFNPYPPEALNTFLELVSLYNESQRFYHNLTHLQQVLETIEKLCNIDEQNGLFPNRKILNLAAWFHDAIYNPQRSDNEQKSADYAREKLTKLAVPTAEIERVRILILCTQTHQAPDRNSQILLDADLAILGAPPADYWEYARAIRKEYAWASDRDYAAGRTRVLSGFLERTRKEQPRRSRIYQTSHLFVKLEAQARANLRAEIARLRA